MRNQNLFEALQNVAGFTALESDMDEIITAYKKDETEQLKMLNRTKNPIIKTTTIRGWIKQNNPSPRLSNILKQYEVLHQCKDINQVNLQELRKIRNCGKRSVDEFKAKWKTS